MLVVLNLGRAEGQLNIDLSTAQLDPDTGNYCVLQKVSFLTNKKTNPVMKLDCISYSGRRLYK